MLVFLDESGDTGHKLESGSSSHFVVSLVMFIDKEEALNCDKRIELLRSELGLPDKYEFHFMNNSRRIRLAFLEAISPYNFSVVSVAINKDPTNLHGEGFKVKSSFYKYACSLVMNNASPYLDNATLVIDRSGSTTFQGELKKYIRKSLEDSMRTKIKKIKYQDSHHNNLLQLVDYFAGISNRKVQDKKDWRDYYKYLGSKEASFQEWPKS